MDRNNLASWSRGSRRFLALPALASAAALGCGAEPDYRADVCKIDGNRNGVVDENNAELGFTAADALAFFRSSSSGNLLWHDSTGASVTLGVDRAPGDAIQIDQFPPGEGYCFPSMRISARLRLATDDGRLDDTWPTTLVAGKRDDGIAIVFPSFVGPLETSADDLVPAAWRTPGFVEAISVDINVARNDSNPYCARGQRVSTDPIDSCNDRDGVLRFLTRPEGPIDLTWEDTQRRVIGSWRWVE